MNNCRECGITIAVHLNDQKILDYFDAPAPTLCATHSLQRRLAWRNERHLYKRTCELCTKDILAMYSPRSYAHVYCHECWYSDGWDPLSYGRPYDSSRSFHDQIANLLRDVPHFNLFQIGESSNSQYCNFMYNSRDSYLSFSNVRSEGSLYCKNADDSRDCTDCFGVTNSELLYDCVSVKDSYRSVFLTRSEKCSECYLGRDLQDCQNCFGCVNLRHKQWYWFNELIGEQEYNARLAEALKNRSSFEEQLKKFEKFSLRLPCEFGTIRSSEDAVGTSLYNSQNIRNSFFINNSENCGDCFRLIWHSKDNYRASYGATVEGSFSSIALPFTSYAVGSFLSEHCSFISYCAFCQNTDNALGCVALRKKKFCILNTQYSEDEYASLTSKIIQDMKDRGEWGEFLSPSYSQHGYNETLAHEYFPISKEEAAAKGWQWQDEQKGARGRETISLEKIPDASDHVDESFTREILACAECGANFKIIKKELARLTLFHIPIPHSCPDCRFTLRSRRSFIPFLYHRACMCAENHTFHADRSCSTEFETTYRPDGKDIVYCHPCYQELMS
ncbi:hypothetical protein HY623_04185 [Candidatus Uhrbacteria bacterium]|nr:hypothetical protein [Candidatus Uhrbacteria bacterium]